MSRILKFKNVAVSTFPGLYEADWWPAQEIHLTPPKVFFLFSSLSGVSPAFHWASKARTLIWLANESDYRFELLETIEGSSKPVEPFDNETIICER